MPDLLTSVLPDMRAFAASVFIGGLIAFAVTYGFAAWAVYRHGEDFRRAWRDNAQGFGIVWGLSIVILMALFLL